MMTQQTLFRQIVFGPPGTGKTTYLIDAVRQELDKGTDPQRIGYFSFTKVAAETARERARAAFHLPQKEFKWFRTLHSLAYNQLGIERLAVVNHKMYNDLGKVLGLKFSRSTDDLAARVLNGDDFIMGHQLVRSSGLDFWRIAKLFKLRTTEVDYRRLVKRMEAWKKHNGFYEFQDLLERFLIECVPMDLDAVFIDEAQDLTALQWRVVRHAFGGVPRMTSAGDDDQCLFGYIGASVKSFLAQPGEQLVLAKSYRVPENLRLYADRIVKRIKNRKEKAWTGTDVKGVRMCLYQDHEVKFVHKEESYLVLARHKCFLKDMHERLIQRGHLHYYNDVLSVDPRDMKASEQLKLIEGGARLPVHKCDELMQASLGRYKFRRNDTIAKRDLERLCPLEKLKWPVRSALLDLHRRHGDTLPREAKIRLSTIHGAKGTEADNVILYPHFTRAAGAAPHNWSAPEHRVFYVAVTRARKRLAVMWPSTPFAYELPTPL